MFKLSPNGNLFRSQRVEGIFSCELVYRDMPFDKHICPVIISFYASNSNEIR